MYETGTPRVQSESAFLEGRPFKDSVVGFDACDKSRTAAVRKTERDTNVCVYVCLYVMYLSPRIFPPPIASRESHFFDCVCKIMFPPS